MNADLALFLIEEGIPLDKAKAIANGSPNRSELALDIMEALPGALSVAEAKAMAERAPVLDGQQRAAAPASKGPRPVAEPGSLPGLEHDDAEHAFRVYAPVVGADGLTDKQRAAVGAGKVGLCPNCQQPNDDHLPACARYSGEVPKAVTKAPLPPSV